MAVKKKEGENLDDDNIAKVIALLEDETPITKKEACEMLNISYNTTRLNNIIQEYKEKIAFKENMKAKMKDKPISETEVHGWIKNYLMGEPITEIAEHSYRSAYTIKKYLEDYKVPIRTVGVDYFNPPMIPEEALRQDYNNGDLTFSVRYNVPAVIKGLTQKHEVHGNVYKIWLMGKEQMFANQPWYELSDLTHLQSAIGNDFNYEE